MCGQELMKLPLKVEPISQNFMSAHTWVSIRFRPISTAVSVWEAHPASTTEVVITQILSPNSYGIKNCLYLKRTEPVMSSFLILTLKVKVRGNHMDLFGRRPSFLRADCSLSRHSVWEPLPFCSSKRFSSSNYLSPVIAYPSSKPVGWFAHSRLSVDYHQDYVS